MLTFILNSGSALKLVHLMQSVQHKELFFFSKRQIFLICIKRNGRPIIYQRCGPSKLTNGNHAILLARRLCIYIMCQIGNLG